MSAIAASWERFWYDQPHVEVRLARVRVAVGLAVVVLATLGPFGSFFSSNAWLYEPSGVCAFLPRLGAFELGALRAIVGASALALSLGCYTRWSAGVCAVGFLVLNGYTSHFTPQLFNYDTHLNFFLFALALVDSNHTLALDRRRQRGVNAASPRARALASFALAFMIAYVALLYAQAFVAKLLLGGAAWFTQGEVLSLQVLRGGTPVGRWLLRWPESFPILSFSTGVFEGLAPLGFIRGGRAARAAAFAAVCFHSGVWLVLGISFWHLLIVLPALFFHRAARARDERAARLPSAAASATPVGIGVTP